jgi:uncharacterized membrane protein YkvA (DUF1232 family)
MGTAGGQADAILQRRPDHPTFSTRRLPMAAWTRSAKTDRTIDASESEVREKFWRTAKRAARQVPFMDEVVAAYYCALDRNTPLRAKGILLAALGYFILPTDTIPDIVLGLGFTDDVAVLTAAITAVRAHMTPAHRLAAKQALAED